MIFEVTQLPTTKSTNLSYEVESFTPSGSLLRKRRIRTWGGVDIHVFFQGIDNMGFLLGYVLGKLSVRTDPKERLYFPPVPPRTLKQTIGAPFVFLGQMLIGLVVAALLMLPVLFILSIGLMGLDIILKFLDHWATRHQYGMVQRFGLMGGLTGVYLFSCYYLMAICRAACREYLQRHRERKKLKQFIKEAEAYANLV